MLLHPQTILVQPAILEQRVVHHLSAPFTSPTVRVSFAGSSSAGTSWGSPIRSIMVCRKRASMAIVSLSRCLRALIMAVGGGNDAAENLRGAVERRIGMARGLMRRAIGGGGAFAGPLDQHCVVGRGLVRIERPWQRPDGERVDHALRLLVAVRGGLARRPATRGPRRGPRTPIDAYRTFLTRRGPEVGWNGVVLHRELQAQGFTVIQDDQLSRVR